MQVEAWDHIVPAVIAPVVSDIETVCLFYTHAMGMQQVAFGDNRKVLASGRQKISIYQAECGFEPKAACLSIGAADQCILTHTPLAEVAVHFVTEGVTVIEGPVKRTGATGPIMSLYIRDPDGNLPELSNQLDA